ncbi:MAG: hypothetical protein ACREV4_13025 [Gammaproteobacteria bacterium]
MGREIPAPHSPLESPEVLPSGPAITEPAGDLTLRQALSLALFLEIEAFAFEVRARGQIGEVCSPPLTVQGANLRQNYPASQLARASRVLYNVITLSF